MHVAAQDQLVGSQDVLALFGLQGMYNQYFRPYMPAAAAAATGGAMLAPPFEPTLKSYIKDVPGVHEFAPADGSLLKLLQRTDLDEPAAHEPVSVDMVNSMFALRPGEVYGVRFGAGCCVVWMHV